MRVRREKNRMPPHGLFRRIALKNRAAWTSGYTFWADGRSRDGYMVTGMGSTARQAVNELVKERKP